MNRLDVKDKRIIYELDVNSRQPNSEIARKVGLSKQVVGFRIKRLVDLQIISSFYTIIDISKLGFTVHKIFLKLQNIDKEKELELIKYLKNNPDVVWVASCDGEFDLSLGTQAKNIEHLDRTLKELNKKFGEYISERQIATILKGEYFIRDYLISKKEKGNFRKSFFGAVPSSAELDDTDWRILLELGKNSRTSAVEIAQIIGISADSIGKRIKQLEKSGVIKHYNIVPNEAKYPYIHYKILVGLKNISEEREKILIEYCRINPNVVYVVKALGSWELEIDMEVENAEQFRRIMMDIKTEFKDIIRDYSSLLIYQVHKYNFCPSIKD